MLTPLFSFGDWMASPNVQIGIVIVTFVATIVAFIIGKIRSDIIALCSTAVLLTTGVIDAKAALAGFSNSAVVMMIGLFVVGGAVFQTGLAKIISGRLLRLAGTDEKRLFFLVMLVTAVVAAFVSNTGTVALLLPIILAMCKTSGVSPSKLMMPLAFASSLGGVLTLIGTPPNLIVSNYLTENGKPDLAFFDFTPIGLILLIVGTLLLWPLCRIFLSKKGRDGAEADDGKSLAGLLHEYHINDCVFRLQATNGPSPIEGCTVQELNLRHRYGVTVLEVRRENRSIFGSVTQETISPETIFSPGDTIYVLGHADDVKKMAVDYHLTVFEDEEREGKGKLDFYEIGLAEV